MGGGLSLFPHRRWDSLGSELPSPRVTDWMSWFGPLQGLGEAGNSHFTCCYFKIILKIKAGYHRLGLSMKCMYVRNIYSSAASKKIRFIAALSYLYLILRVSIISLADLFLVQQQPLLSLSYLLHTTAPSCILIFQAMNHTRDEILLNFNPRKEVESVKWLKWICLSSCSPSGSANCSAKGQR